MPLQQRLIVIVLHPATVQCGPAGEIEPAVAVRPVIGYIKEMSPFLPVPHATQLRGHWIHRSLDEIEQRIQTRHVNPLTPGAGFQALHDFLGDVARLVTGEDFTAHPWFLAIHVPHLASAGGKLAEIAFEALGVSSLALFDGGEGGGTAGRQETAGDALHRWQENAALALHAWARGMFVPRSRYEAEGSACIKVLDRDAFGPA